MPNIVHVEKDSLGSSILKENIYPLPTLMDFVFLVRMN